MMTATGAGHAKRAVLIIAVLALVIAHGSVLYYGASRVHLPVVIIGVVAALIVMKHLGLGRRLLSLLRDPSDRE